ncbi:RHS repeat-associated core domain-containing protein [Microbulbifer sp. 2304DJ12-6]|uniref:RHS repeat-associated core domain-containing protein n=1 Tax=Microbulbifer sp. 2304DJ12-6 TaxID=3233340 RepID=UPI0039AEF445
MFNRFLILLILLISFITSTAHARPKDPEPNCTGNAPKISSVELPTNDSDGNYALKFFLNNIYYTACSEIDVQVSTNGSNYVYYTNGLPGSNTINISNAASAAYKYRVQHYYAGSGHSSYNWVYSNELIVLRKPNKTGATSFSNIEGGTDRNGVFSLSWGASQATPNFTGYQVQQCAGTCTSTSGSWSQIYSAADRNKRTIRVPDSGTISNGKYRYRVRSYIKVKSHFKYSDWQYSSYINVNRKPDAITNFTQPSGGTQSSDFQVAWSAPPGVFDPITKYQIQCDKDGAGFTFNNCGDDNTGTTTTHPVSLPLGTSGTFKFRARAENAAGWGPWTPAANYKTVSVNIPLPTPSGVTISTPESSEFGDYDISWNASGGVTAYELQRYCKTGVEACGDDGWHTVQLNNATAKTYEARGHLADKYKYRVKACNDGSCTGWKTSDWVKVHNLDGIAPAVSLATATIPGKMAYTTNVTRTGDAVIKIPVEVAPGVNDFTPAVNITYSGARFRKRKNESLPEDYLGYGWKIGGFGSIRRCVVGRPNTDKIELTLDDSICLNGEPLILVNGDQWASGSTYRTAKDSFHKITIKYDRGLWFQVETPDGTIQEYGKTNDSRLRVGKSVYFGWTLNKETDTFGNIIEYKYHRDTVEGINYPLEITYGNNSDSRIVFEYGTRSDAPPQPLDSEEIQQEQLVLLHHIKVLYDDKPVRKYKLISEDEGEIEDYRRLKHVQKCAFDANGINEQCLNPMSFDWHVPEEANPINFSTGVAKVTDSLGEQTKFFHTMLRANSNDGFFSEEPFGQSVTPGNGIPLAAVNGNYKTVITEVWRSDGNVDGWHKTNYAYQGNGYVSKNRRGFLGYSAQRIHDRSANIVTYRQFRLDYPFIGRVAREMQYVGLYPASSEMLAKRQLRYGNLDLSIGVNSTKYVYIKQSLEWILENGQTLGYKFSTNTPQKAAYGNDGELIQNLVKADRYALSANAPTGQNFWGDVQPVSVTGIRRSIENIITYNNRPADWLLSFKEAEQVSYHNGPLSKAADIVQNVVYTPYQNSMKIATSTRFPENAKYELTTKYSYDDSGNILSETITGAGIEERTSTIDNYIDKRFPTTLTNALGQITALEYDKRFNQVKAITANGQTTRIHFDNFGREKKRINPNGVGFSTTREFCTADSCPVYGGQLAAYQVTLDSPITPSSTTYYDILGRAIQQDTQAFDGVDTIRKEINYDSLGRKYLETTPYFVGNQKPLTTYQFDIRNRITQLDRPDGSQVRTSYTPANNGSYTVRIEEDILNSAGALQETQIKINTLTFLGDLALTIEGVGTAERVATKYTYNGSGLLTSTVVDNDNSTKTILNYDPAGYQSAMTAPDTGLISTMYNALGELISSTNNSGQIVVNSYDKLGRLRFKEDDQGIAEWTYDPINGAGLLGSRIYTRGGNEVFKEVNSYNADAQLDSIDTTLRAGGLVRTYQQEYSYDSRGRLASVTSPDGAAVHYQYNGRGYLQKLTDGANTLKTFDSMNALGQAQSESYGNGIATTRAYNPNTGRLESIASTGAQVVQNNVYSWRSNGTLESRTVSGAGSTVKREEFSYDGLNRLETAQTWLDNTSRRTLTTLFDRLGNIQSKTSSVAGDTQVTGYQYGQNTNAGTHAATSATIDGTSYTFHYNQNGAVIRYDAATGDDKWITWNARQLPTEITVGSSQSTQNPTARDRFHYGPDGQRFYRESSYWDESAQQLVTDKTFIVGGYEDFLPGNDPDYRRIQKTRVNGDILLFSITDNAGLTVNTVEYLHLDHLGSVEKVTDADGNILLGALAYDPYGSRKSGDWSGEISNADLKALLAAQGLSTNRGFTNHEQLDRTGLIHMNGRIYDPVLGRFLSPDPIVQAPALSQSWNRYSYVMNNPLSANDPTGFIMDEVSVTGYYIEPDFSWLWTNSIFGGNGGDYNWGGIGWEGLSISNPLSAQKHKDTEEAKDKLNDQGQELEEVVVTANCQQIQAAGGTCGGNSKRKWWQPWGTPGARNPWARPGHGIAIGIGFDAIFGIWGKAGGIGYYKIDYDGDGITDESGFYSYGSESVAGLDFGIQIEGANFFNPESFFGNSQEIGGNYKVFDVTISNTQPGFLVAPTDHIVTTGLGGGLPIGLHYADITTTKW